MTPDFKEEPEQIEGFTCEQCGFDLRLPPQCTKENWETLHEENVQLEQQLEKERNQNFQLKQQLADAEEALKTIAERQHHEVVSGKDSWQQMARDYFAQHSQGSAPTNDVLKPTNISSSDDVGDDNA